MSTKKNDEATTSKKGKEYQKPAELLAREELREARRQLLGNENPAYVDCFVCGVYLLADERKAALCRSCDSQWSYTLFDLN